MPGPIESDVTENSARYPLQHENLSLTLTRRQWVILRDFIGWLPESDDGLRSLHEHKKLFADVLGSAIKKQDREHRDALARKRNEKNAGKNYAVCKRCSAGITPWGEDHWIDRAGNFYCEGRKTKHGPVVSSRKTRKAYLRTTVYDVEKKMRCPTCAAEPGEMCVTANGTVANSPHSARFKTSRRNSNLDNVSGPTT